MATLADFFPYFEVQFTKDGEVNEPAEVQQLLDFVSQGNTTDLFAVSHGWNNDMPEARQLYEELFERVRDEILGDRPTGIGDRKFAVFGILWPSKKFADEEDIASGAASLAAPEPDTATLVKQLEDLKGFFDNPRANDILTKAQTLAPNVENDPVVANQFVDLIRSLPTQSDQNADDNSDKFFTIPSSDLMDVLSRPDLAAPPEPGTGGAADFDAGTALGIKDFFGGLLAGVRKALNFTTYFQMKQRAGVVGRSGVNDTLKKIRQANPNLKLHLVGHSFGGRLVTSATDASDASNTPNTLSLLQAAFSHNGFAQKFDGNRDGFFRAVLASNKVSGPIIVTHSILDCAVGIAYPIASKLSDDDAAGFGGPDDRFGGIGRNGAQHTPEADDSVPLGPNTAVYSFHSGKVHNLNADTVIQGHSDIRRSEVAHAILCSVATT